MFEIKNIKTFIFDLDGTIIDTERLYNLCWRQSCEFYGYNLTFEDALNLRSLDSELAKIYFKNLFGDECNYANIRAKRKELMQSLIENQGIEPKQNILNVLNLIKKAGYKVAICSASTVETVNYSLKLAGINFEFDKIISAKNVQRGKPYPDVYLYTCECLNILPQEALVIEDSPNGILSAKKAGCNVCMIPDLSEPTNILKENIDLLFNNLYDF